ncbi:type II secretion system protein [bacterium]|nr:type II secretion system protein [bacterium]
MINEEQRTRSQEDKPISSSRANEMSAAISSKTCHAERRINLRVSGSHNNPTTTNATLTPHPAPLTTPLRCGKQGHKAHCVAPVPFAPQGARKNKTACHSEMNLASQRLNVLASFKKVAFTLAEVLITLGIIGIVAAMTMPALITKYQKQVTVNRLKHAYTVLSQAVKLSEVENGSIDDWTWPIDNNSDAVEVWLKQYICPYLKYTDIINPTPPQYLNEPGLGDRLSNLVSVKITNGTILSFWFNSDNRVHVFVTLSLNKKMQNGKNQFVFFVSGRQGYYHSVLDTSMAAVRPYDYSLSGQDTNTRAFWRDNSFVGCNRNNERKSLCAGLIMFDGWQIKDDYPW